MSSLTSETCTSCLLSARSRRIFCIRGAFGLAIAGLGAAIGFARTIGMLRHFSRRFGVAAFVRRLGLQGGFSIFTSVRGHVIRRSVSLVEWREVAIRGRCCGPIQDVLTLQHQSGRCHLDPVRGPSREPSPARIAAVRPPLRKHPFPGERRGWKAAWEVAKSTIAVRC